MLPRRWVIVGGESGIGARPMEVGWARVLRDQCRAASVPFFFKQWGGRTPKAGGRMLDGLTWDEYPVSERAFAGVGRAFSRWGAGSDESPGPGLRATAEGTSRTIQIGGLGIDTYPKGCRINFRPLSLF